MKNTDSRTPSNRRQYLLILAGGWTASFGVLSQVTANPPIVYQTQIIPSPTSAPGNYFALQSLCIGHDRIVASDPRDDTLQTDAGAAYVFHRGETGWAYETKLIPASRPGSPYQPHYVGSSCSVSGDAVAVGSIAHSQPHMPPDPVGGGDMFVFREAGGNWSQLELTSPSTEMNFGEVADIDVAAPGNQGTASLVMGWTGNGGQDGRAYVFDCCGPNANAPWVGNPMFEDPTGQPVNDFFGKSVSVSGDFMVIGAPGYDDDLARPELSGAAWVYLRASANAPGNRWALLAELMPSERYENDLFGYSVSIDGDVIAIGAPGCGQNCARPAPEDHGVVYIFRRNGTGGWPQEAKLVGHQYIGIPPDPICECSDINFGTHVRVQGDHILTRDTIWQTGNGCSVFGYHGGVWTRDMFLGLDSPGPVPLDQVDFFGNTVVRLYRESTDHYLLAVWELSQVTAAGTDITVQPENPADGSSPVTLTFDNVTQEGTTTLTTSGQGNPPPSGFRLGSPPTYYSISTTAVFSGNVEICIDYTNVQFPNESTLKLFHDTGSGWANITTSQDMANNIICGVTTSFSDFVIAESSAQIPAMSAIGELAMCFALMAAGIAVYIKRNERRKMA